MGAGFTAKYLDWPLWVPIVIIAVCCAIMFTRDFQTQEEKNVIIYALKLRDKMRPQEMDFQYYGDEYLFFKAIADYERFEKKPKGSRK